MDIDPLLKLQEDTAGYLLRRSSGKSSSRFSLVLCPDISIDEHLLPLYDCPWTPDGKEWFHANISFLQGGNGKTYDDSSGVDSFSVSASRGSGEEITKEELRGAGLSITLWPEGSEQKRQRLESEAKLTMRVEDNISRVVGARVARSEKEAKNRELATEEARASSILAKMVSAAKVSA